jgi:hypothetical protein
MFLCVSARSGFRMCGAEVGNEMAVEVSVRSHNPFD